LDSRADDVVPFAATEELARKSGLTVRQLERGERLRFSPWSLGMLVAFFLGLLGLFLTSYLLFGLGN